MTYELSPERLQEISVRVVSKLMTKQADLSSSIAEEAKSLELNPEQIKRVIESSNTIAYLRQLEDASDRTFEFPVADYTTVMGRLVIPSAPAVTAQAVSASTPAPAAIIPGEQYSSISTQEKMAMLSKEAMRIKQVLVKMASEEQILTISLTKAAEKFSKDPRAMEKLAHISPETSGVLAVLCGLTKEASSKGSVFSNSDLSEAISLNSLLKEAKEMLAERAEKEEFVKRAFSILNRPSQAAHSSLNVAGKAIGTVANPVAMGVGKAVGSTVRAGAHIGKKIGKGIIALGAGKTVGGRLSNLGDVAGGAMAVAAERLCRSAENHPGKASAGESDQP